MHFFVCGQERASVGCFCLCEGGKMASALTEWAASRHVFAGGVGGGGWDTKEVRDKREEIRCQRCDLEVLLIFAGWR